MNHILDINEQENELNNIFLKIKDSNTILFLGAGASVGEKKYLSKEIIEYYESRIGKQINEKDITRWIDVISADRSFNRTDFDQFVCETLEKLKISESHSILASILGVR